MSAVTCGIDFGTTNSSIAVKSNGTISVIDVDEGADMAETLRSVVFVHRDDDRDAGRDAARKYGLQPSARHGCNLCDKVTWYRDGARTDCEQFKFRKGCYDARLMSGLKSLVPDRDFKGTSSWGSFFTTADLIAIVLKKLRRAAEEQMECTIDRAVIGYPVHFGAAELWPKTSATLASAAEIAGFSQVRLEPEPVAAIHGDSVELTTGTVCSVDFGGGTFDVAVLRFPESESDPAVLATAGIPVGGDVFDSMLFEHLISSELALNRPIALKQGGERGLPSGVRSGLKSLEGTLRMAADVYIYREMRELEQVASSDSGVASIIDLLYGGHAYPFWTEVERTKRELSSREWSTFSYRRGRIDVEARVSRSQFEDLIRPKIDEIRGAIEGAIQRAELEPSDIDVVIRTGGSSLLPIFNDMLDDLFGAVRVEARPPFTSVATGLADTASRIQWKGTSVVPPPPLPSDLAPTESAPIAEGPQLGEVDEDFSEPDRVRPPTTEQNLERCPFCSQRFPSGDEWRAHFINCPERFAKATEGASSYIATGATRPEGDVRGLRDQERVRLRQRIAELERENDELRNRIKSAQEALGEAVSEADSDAATGES